MDEKRTLLSQSNLFEARKKVNMMLQEQLNMLSNGSAEDILKAQTEFKWTAALLRRVDDGILCFRERERSKTAYSEEEISKFHELGFYVFEDGIDVPKEEVDLSPRREAFRPQEEIRKEEIRNAPKIVPQQTPYYRDDNHEASPDHKRTPERKFSSSLNEYASSAMKVPSQHQHRVRKRISSICIYIILKHTSPNT